VESFDVEAFLETRVTPHLGEMERLRIRALAFYLVGGFLVFGSIISAHLSEEGLSLPALAGFALAAGALYFARSAGSERRDTFKRVVMKQLLAEVFPDLAYHPDACVSESIYNESRLFLKSYDRYRGDDFVSGRIGDTDICFSELDTAYKTHTRDSKGRSRTEWHTIFSGIFFRADFHKHFAGATFVLPDKAQSMLGEWLGQSLQALASSHGELVKLEDPRFEQAFVTYASDQQEARYILTPSLMERMVEMRERFETQTYFAFIAGRVYVAIESDAAHFEPSLFTTGVSPEEVGIHLAVIRAVIGIVEDLNLNQRIWTKA
jgi:hypothetical protein